MLVASYIYIGQFAPKDTTQLWVEPKAGGNVSLHVFSDGGWKIVGGGDGKSAYELAVEKGYSGTLDEWLDSLQGKSFTYDDLTDVQRAELAQDAVAAANRAAQAVETIEAAINDLDPSQSAEDAVVALAARQGVLENGLSALGPKIDQLESTGIKGNVPNEKSDLDIEDGQHNVLARFAEGHILTRYFDSKKATTGMQISDVDGDSDFELKDGLGKVLFRIKQGHIQTQNFDSSKLIDNGSKYTGKKISILGDSISSFGDPDSRNLNGTYCYSYYPRETCRYSVDGNVEEEGTTYESFAFDVEDMWWMKLIRKCKATLGINESRRGTRVSGTGADAFNSQTRISHLGENGVPDLILVYGGTNDAGGSVDLGVFDGGTYSDYNTSAKIASLSTLTFADAYKAMLIRLMATYPTSEIVCVLPTFTTSYYTIQELDDYVEVIKEACDFFGIKWIDVRVSGINIFNKGTYLIDGIHPNANGMSLLAEKIYKQLIYM